MAYEEIFQWVRDNIELDPSQSSEQNFNDINKIFEADGRSDLSDILGDEKPKFLEFIEEATNQLPEDIELAELEQRPFERLDRLARQSAVLSH